MDPDSATSLDPYPRYSKIKYEPNDVYHGNVQFPMIFVPFYPDFGQNIFICEICMNKFGGQELDPMIPSQPGSGFIFLDADPQHCISMVLYKKKIK